MQSLMADQLIPLTSEIFKDPLIEVLRQEVPLRMQLFFFLGDLR